MKIKNIVTALVVVFILSSCSPPLIVRLDTLGFPQAGGMGGSTGWAYKSDLQNFDCYTETDCMKIVYDQPINDRDRLGWSFWSLMNCGPNLIGTEGLKCTTDFLNSINLKEIQRLTLWARGENGNEIVEFGVGNGNEVVDFLDGFEYRKPQGQSSGRVTLTTDWEKYEIDLVASDLTRAVPLFYAYHTAEDNPQGATYYLDDIQFEGY